jgi:hypothetical protein
MVAWRLRPTSLFVLLGAPLPGFAGLFNKNLQAVFWTIFDGTCLSTCGRGRQRVYDEVVRAGFLPSTMQVGRHKSLWR